MQQQGEKDAERIRALGAPADRVRVSGNFKYDLELPAPTALSNWLASEIKRSGRSPVIVAGSVVATEERDYVCGRLLAEIWEITAEEWNGRGTTRRMV